MIFGVWGYGIVGQSVARFVSNQGYRLAIMDKNHLARAKALTDFPTALIFEETQKQSFFSLVDYLLPSPGVDVRDDYRTLKDKLHFELDIFFAHWKKNIVAITGSIGKTSVTHFLASILHALHEPIMHGGNIGIGVCDLLNQKNDLANQTVILELSSFQLEHTKHFAPSLAILTNVYANHLDRHGNLINYFKAKYKIFEHQKKSDSALIPLSAQPLFEQYKYPPSTIHWFADIAFDPLSTTIKERVYALEKNYIGYWSECMFKPLYALADLPPLTVDHNWLTLVAALDIMRYPLEKIATITSLLKPIPHRMERCGTCAGVTFYNDSKATSASATLHAATQCQTRHSSVTLLLGGLGKGVDRTPLIASLAKYVSFIICFGAEAEILAHACALHNITHMKCTTLDEAFKMATNHTRTNGCILLSPSGSSYDLYTNFEERGDHFKKLFEQYRSTATVDQRNGFQVTSE